MKQVQKKHSAWLQTLLTVVLSVLIASAVWIGRYGVPLLGLPKAEDVQSVTLVSLDSGSVTVTDTENVELLVKAANLLNYKLGAPDTTDPELTVKLQVFEGPLDLLLYLLEKNKVNIYDIPIVEITEQYMEYIREMKRQDLEVLSEFLVMAATLIDIKSRMLLPSNPDSEEEEEDPRAELVQQLLEYKMYKCMAYELKDRQMDAGRVMYKKPTIPEEVRAYEPPVDIHELMSDITLSRLHEIFESIMKKQQDKIDPLRSKFGKIEKEEVSLEDKMEDLKKYAAGHRHFSFRGLLTAQSSKVEVIVTFLAILELMKMGTIRISQEHIFDDIQIDSKVAA